MKSSAAPSCANSDNPATAGSVFNIQRFSLHDGPGVRTVVFLKGCQMSCAWCANPESWRAEPELFFDRERCRRHSDACPHPCPGRSSAPFLWTTTSEAWPPESHCPAAAIRRVGSQMTVEAVMRQVLADAIYYRSSGGGMTLSGGEITQQSAFSRALLLRAREEGIHGAIETSGFAAWSQLWRVCEASHLVLFDIKFASDALHQQYTGVSNNVILANLRKLLEYPVPLRIRIPVIPDVNDNDREAREIITTIARLTRNKASFEGIDLLPYHAFGLRKYALSGKVNGYAENNPDPRAARTGIFASIADDFNIQTQTLSFCIG